MTGIGGGITGRIGGCLGPVVCTVSARMSGVEFSVGLAVVSINTAQHESLRATCTTLAVGQRQWGTINPPDVPGLVVAGSRWVLSVPRLFLCVGAPYPIRRQCTSSVRVHRHITGAAPRNGCSAPCLWRLPGMWASSGLGLSSAWAVFCLEHFVVPLWRLMLWFLRNVARNSPACISNVEITSLEFCGFLDTYEKLGYPNYVRVLVDEAPPEGRSKTSRPATWERVTPKRLPPGSAPGSASRRSWRSRPCCAASCTPPTLSNR